MVGQAAVDAALRDLGGGGAADQQEEGGDQQQQHLGSLCSALLSAARLISCVRSSVALQYS